MLPELACTHGGCLLGPPTCVGLAPMLPVGLGLGLLGLDFELLGLEVGLFPDEGVVSPAFGCDAVDDFCVIRKTQQTNACQISEVIESLSLNLVQPILIIGVFTLKTGLGRYFIFCNQRETLLYNIVLLS